MSNAFIKNALRGFAALLVAAVALVSASCERDITLDLPRPDPKVVVHGHIENDGYAYVSLSRNLFIFDRINYDSLQQYFITDAKVTLSDGQQSEVLKPGLLFENYTPYTYIGSVIKGQVGRTYTLTIEWEGFKLQATTYMPNPAPLDSIYWRPDPTNEGDDTLLVPVFYRYTDPDTPGNFVRLFSKINSETMFSSDYQSAYTDVNINGGSVEFLIRRGKEPFELGPPGSDTMPEQSFETFGQFRRGDTVYVKWASMDRAHFNFWNTLEQSAGNVGNPFSTPSPVTSNIRTLEGSKGDGLGIWGAYSVFPIAPLIIPK